MGFSHRQKLCFEKHLNDTTNIERAAVAIPSPEVPKAAEIEAHELTHYPAKAWCRFCQMGKRRQTGHRSIFPSDREREGSPVQMDYVFLKSDGERTDVVEEAWSTTLVCVHVGAGMARCTSV